MSRRKIANAVLIFMAVLIALPLIAAVMPFAAAVWGYCETDDE